MRIYPLLACLALASGCQYDPYADTYTTQKPQTTNVVGRYNLTSQTFTKDGLAALNGKACMIELLSDGTFAATNVPPMSSGFPPTNFFDTLISGSGTWSIGSVGTIANGRQPSKTHWGIDLDSGAGARMQAPGLTGTNPPYGLIYTLGDPDSGEALFLQRAK